MAVKNTSNTDMLYAMVNSNVLKTISAEDIKSNSENLYSDDSIEDVAVNFSEVDVEIELNQFIGVIGYFTGGIGYILSRTL